MKTHAVITQWSAYSPYGAGREAFATGLAARRTAAHTRVYVSWNGDTEVAHWTVLAGAGSGAGLRALQPALRTGFETVIEVPATVTHVRVRGSDATGGTLATSALVSV